MLDRVKDQGIDIAITNGGGLRAAIDAGEVTMGEVLTVLPFQNTLATFRLKGERIVQALENGVSQVEEGAGRFPQVAGMSPSGIRRSLRAPASSRWRLEASLWIRRRCTASFPTTTCGRAATAIRCSTSTPRTHTMVAVAGTDSVLGAAMAFLGGCPRQSMSFLTLPGINPASRLNHPIFRRGRVSALIREREMSCAAALRRRFPSRRS